MKLYFVLKTGVKKIFLNYSFSWAKTGAKKADLFPKKSAALRIKLFLQT